MAPDPTTRNLERLTTQHYTMKTPVTKPPLTSSHSHHHPHHHHHHHHPRHSQLNSQAFRANRSTTTPAASPRMAHSVGQPYPPATKLSPAIIGSSSRSPSPNYFGLNVERSVDSRDSNAVPNENWSPPSSSVRSFAAAIPAQVPLDANPEFEEFRRQADANRNQGFTLSGTHFGPVQPLSPAFMRPKPPRRPTGNSDSASEVSVSKVPNGKLRDVPVNRMDIDADSLHDSAYVSSDSKRNSEASLNPPAFTSMPRFESPAQFESPFEPTRRTTFTKVDDRHPRLSLPLAKLEQASSESAKPRADTLPATLESGSGLISASQLKEILENSPDSEYLILDVRVSTQYAQSRIRDALNLCIPTTLLKRATFDLQKLLKTLQTEEDQEKFAQWQKVKYLVVYDASSTEKRDAVPAMNMLKKFANEGFSGSSYLLKGGFQTFANSYPALVDRRSAADRAGTSVNPSGDGRPLFAPVIGGVALPAAANNPNPFFNNIRQNMDLADGVGQMDISVPSNVDSSTLPVWLREATRASDHGKLVSESFLQIERNEQSRMKDAYAAFTPGGARGRVRLSGVEKGVKNRYKDILPFEHARVRLGDRGEGSCDYINASYIKASRSNKRYIASQGPLPATFDDFWSVIWDQDVRVIVMLTAESEGGQLKCHPYWQSREFGPIRLKHLSEKKVSLDIDKPRTSSTATASTAAAEAGRRRAMTTNVIDSSNPNLPTVPSQPVETPHVIIRKFALSHAAHPFAPMREITHLHYPSWPDFGTPAQPSHLLALVELANVMQRAALPVDANVIAASAASERPTVSNWYDEPESNTDARPMLVHCSAGCGRTGTFCTVDSVIDMLKRQRLASPATDKQQQRDTDGDVQMEDGERTEKTYGILSNGKQEIDTSFIRDMSADLIAATVEDFRRQRLSMVQSLRQFVLCYETVLEWIWRSQDMSNGLSTARTRARSGSLEIRR